MSAISNVRRFLNTLEPGSIFCSRSLLHLGTVTAVNQALYRLAKQGEIVRLSKGIYYWGTDLSTIPSAAKVASIKAEAYGKQILIDESVLKSRLGSSSDNPSVITFLVDGHTSEFKYGDLKIVFKSASARKLKLVKQGGPALSLAALWQLGKRRVTRAEVWQTNTYKSHDKDQLRAALNYVPKWLSDFYSKK